MTTPDQGMPQEAPPAPGQAGGNGLAIAGLIFAILSLPGSIIGPLGLGLAILGLVLSIFGTKKAGERGGAGKGVAIAGIVVGIIGILVGGAVTTCQAACASGMHKAAETSGFHSFGDMMKAAAQMPEKLNAAAKKAGYSSFQEWNEKDPKAASAAAAKISRELGLKAKKTGEEMQGAGGGTTGSGAGAPSGGGGTGN